MFVAVIGCNHGMLNGVYEALAEIERSKGIKTDLLLCCGDFQSIRNENDMKHMAVPSKYAVLGDFADYYYKKKMAYCLTIFIGGNHEDIKFLKDLYLGGWVAPQIFFMGFSNCVQVHFTRQNLKGDKEDNSKSSTGECQSGCLRICGLSGIYKKHDYNKGFFEKSPFDDSSKRSAYHVREFDVFKMSQLDGGINIMLSHDWPNGIEKFGNTQQLLSKKPFFRDEIESEQLGNQATRPLLDILKPNIWFAAHLHCKFSAVYQHDVSRDQTLIDRMPPQNDSMHMTKFLALDKVLPRRGFLQVFKISESGEMNFNLEMIRSKETIVHDVRICFDPQWLSILQRTMPLIPLTQWPQNTWKNSMKDWKSEDVDSMFLQLKNNPDVKQHNCKDKLFFEWKQFNDYEDCNKQQQHIYDIIGIMNPFKCQSTKIIPVYDNTTEIDIEL